MGITKIMERINMEEKDILWIKSVKLQGEGYLVNGSMSVPNDEQNRHMKDVKVWLDAGNTPEPEFTAEEIQAQELSEAISKAKTLLSDTDFYVIRKMEEDIAIPADVITARAEAKQLLRDNNISYSI